MSAKSTDGDLNLELLRFTTVGSVDDGKSTLIGRLLYDTKSIFEDQLSCISIASEIHGEEQLKLSLLTDGLRAEREQGITIDVAYHYFTTARRKFIVADTPGHIQYTRNMAGGASTADLALILIDARKGVVEQTRRHVLCASLLKIQQFVVCVNKMDLVDYREDIFNLIKSNFNNFSAKLELKDIHFIPVCALNGDNVVNLSTKMPWYKNDSLLNLLETIPISSNENLTDGRFPVQYVIRGNNSDFLDYKGYAGRIAGGVFKPGDKVLVLPSELITHIKSIDTFDGPVDEAFAPMSVAISLDGGIEVSRGDMIVHENNVPTVAQEFDIMLCWFNDKKLSQGHKYLFKHTAREIHCSIKEIRYKVDVNTVQRIEKVKEIGLNDTARITVSTAQPLFFDKYENNRVTGSIILIDESTNETVGVGMIL